MDTKVVAAWALSLVVVFGSALSSAAAQDGRGRAVRDRTEVVAPRRERAQPEVRAARAQRPEHNDERASKAQREAPRTEKRNDRARR